MCFATANTTELSTMIKFQTLLFGALLLTACGSPPPQVSAEPLLPIYCIRSVTDNGDGTVTLDMPGLMSPNDKPMIVSKEIADTLISPGCSLDDPRMNI